MQAAFYYFNYLGYGFCQTCLAVFVCRYFFQK